MKADSAQAPSPGNPMLIHIVHKTTFTYAGHANNNFNEVRLRPVDDALQSCRRFQLRTHPESAPRDYTDFYGNSVYYFDVLQSHESLTVEVASEVETVADDQRQQIPEASFETFSASIDRDMLAEYLAETKYVVQTDALRGESAAALSQGRRDMWSDIRAIAAHLSTRLKVMPNVTTVSTSADEALRLGRGVCQDYAHVMLALCRAAGLPVRYVSGYFFDPGHDPSRPEASHAWIEAYIPGYGWAAYDPMHNRPCNQNYVKVATGRDYADIVPISGTYCGAPSLSMGVEVAVREIASPTA